MKVTWPTSANTSTKKARLAGGTKSRRVFVGLSGGVDSAVSAALLKKDGYDVTGVFIRIAIDGYPCTAGQDKLDAMRVAVHLRIPFLTVDFSEEYKKRVFEISLTEFAKGRTPNPDALCNREIKFGLFFDWCVTHGADYVATGHYAQTKDGQLFISSDENKDQSYFLWAVSESKLRQTLFPIGSLKKTEVRALAKKFGLPNAERPDSQGLCFLGPISIDEMLHQELSLVSGDVVDSSGAVVGRHEGAAAYTLGQRHRFELFAHTPETRPHFVVAKDVVHNTITVSAGRFPPSVTKTHIVLSDTNWIGAVEDGEYMARYRYRQKLIHAELKNGLVILKEPHYVPLGQSLVLYKNNRCIGGGVILESIHGASDS